MGADLISICAVHPGGPITSGECDKAVTYLKRLHEAARSYQPTKFKKGGRRIIDRVVNRILYLETMDPEGEGAVKEALELIKVNTEKPEELIGIFHSFCRDMGGRPWRGSFIYYAGQLSWGDEPDGWGYQSLKWIFLLGADKALGLE